MNEPHVSPVFHFSVLSFQMRRLSSCFRMCLSVFTGDFCLFSCHLWLFTLALCPPAETPQQVAGHEVPPRFGPPSVRGGGASRPREGGLHRVGAVLREEGVCRSPAAPLPLPHPPTPTDPNPSFPPSPPGGSTGTLSPGISTKRQQAPSLCGQAAE